MHWRLLDRRLSGLDFEQVNIDAYNHNFLLGRTEESRLEWWNYIRTRKHKVLQNIYNSWGMRRWSKAQQCKAARWSSMACVELDFAVKVTSLDLIIHVQFVNSRFWFQLGTKAMQQLIQWNMQYQWRAKLCLLEGTKLQHVTCASRNIYRFLLFKVFLQSCGSAFISVFSAPSCVVTLNLLQLTIAS